MNYRLLSNQQQDSFILIVSQHLYNHDYNISRDFDRSTSLPQTESYYRSLRRAFARSKELAFFNPDLLYFITFTYKSNDHTPEQVLEDIKYLIKVNRRSKNQPFLPKYIYILERQKRGSIHVHMVANDFLETIINRNGYKSVKYWKHGFSSVLHISDLDRNFKPYLYLFKYMKKSERIGKSFIHTSRSFDKTIVLDYDKYHEVLRRSKIVFREDNTFILNETEQEITKLYFKKES